MSDSPDGRFVRDPDNRGALKCVDHEGLRAYRLRKAKAGRINKMEEEQAKMKRDLEEIKDMLAFLVTRSAEK